MLSALGHIAPSRTSNPPAVAAAGSANTTHRAKTPAARVIGDLSSGLPSARPALEQEECHASMSRISASPLRNRLRRTPGAVLGRGRAATESGLRRRLWALPAPGQNARMSRTPIVAAVIFGGLVLCATASDDPDVAATVAT